MFHSFKQFHRNTMAPCFIFLGAKIEEQPRKLEHVLKVAYRCLHKDSDAQLDIQSDEYMQMSQDLVDNESILLQTLGFDLSVEHPHTYVVKCAQMVKAAKELAQTSYFLATNSLHLTTFCIEQKPTVVACVCIFVACKWTSYEIPETHDKKHWWEYMDSNTTIAKIEEMSTYFIKILDSCPTRLKKKISTGPVIYKGGALQLKKEDEDETSKPDKAIEASFTKAPDKGDKKNPTASSNSSRSGQSLEKQSHKHSKKPEQTHDVKKDHSNAPPTAHKHSKPKQGELDRKNIEHSKHHKHSSHQSKHASERSKLSEEQSQKRPDMTRPDRPDKVKVPDSKAAATANRPSDVVSKPKVPQSEELSSAAKLIMSLPPLQHKHSLPDSDRLSSNESPAKKQRIETSPPKKPKPELDSSKVSVQSDGQITSSSISHRKHKSHHSKEGVSSAEKHKMKIPTDKHSHKHKQQTSEKSAHGQKHHSNVSSSKHGKEKSAKSGHQKSSGVLGLEGTQRHSSKVKSESTPSPFKMSDESPRLSDGDTKLMPQKPLPTHKKPSSGDKRSHSGSKPSKNGHSKTTPFKKDALSSEPLLPPPPPPPSVEVSSFLNSPPPLPTGPPEPDKQRIPAPPGNSMSSQYGLPIQQSIQQGELIQNQSHQGQLQQGLYSMHQQVLPQTPGLAPQSYQQQQQQQFVVTSANNYGIPQLYYQGQQDQSGSTETYGQPLNTPNMFAPSNMNVLAQPPRPPEGLVLQQIVGLPPPPPLTLPLGFPHPPT